ncbi:MAG: hypothetical protein RL153_1695 [Verrucomicrobiota bacterium]|jgi:gas vesicle protein
MKLFRHLAILASTVIALGALAQNPPAKPEGDGPGRPGRPGGPGRPGLDIPRIGIPKNVELPEDVKKLVTQYQDAAKKFADEQKSLISQIRGATEEDKAKLKEQLKSNRDKFLEDTKQLRADIREQVRDLRAKLKENGGAVDGGTEGKGKGRN